MKKKDSKDDSSSAIIDVKIVSKEEAFWSDVKKAAEREKEAIEKAMKFQTAIIELADNKIEKARKDELQA